jgi:hypothetical protein
MSIDYVSYWNTNISGGDLPGANRHSIISVRVYELKVMKYPAETNSDARD